MDQRPQHEREELAELLQTIEAYLCRSRLLRLGQQVRTQIQTWRDTLFQQQRWESLWRTLRWS